MVVKIQDVTLHDVWAPQLEEEFARLRDFIDDYPYVAMDTEFPGVVNTPMGQFKSKEDFNYQQLMVNVNVLKLIQVGFTLMNEKGELPPNRDIWQFNLHFSLADDMFSAESVDLLKIAGFDFNRHQTEGILMEDFGELLTTSGLLVDPRITWMTFHSCFDFGYLIKAIMLGELPSDEKDFFQYHKKLFPNSYDIKMMLRQPGPMTAMLKGGLQEVADQLHVQRIGQRHQAGSDSLLTAMTFFKIRELFFEKNWKEVAAQIQGQMFGLSNGSTTPYTPPMIPYTPAAALTISTPIQQQLQSRIAAALSGDSGPNSSVSNSSNNNNSHSSSTSNSIAAQNNNNSSSSSISLGGGMGGSGVNSSPATLLQAQLSQ